MVERLDRMWRVCATGFCFSSFGMGGLMLRVFVFPVLSLLPWSDASRQRACRQVIHHAFRLFVWLMHTVGVIRCDVLHGERLRRNGLLVVANHPSLIDVVFLMSLIPRPDCVVKSALVRNPFTRGPVLATGWVRNDVGAAMVDDCIASLRSGNNLIIFPEGTRTRPDGPLTLRRGAANVAVRGGFALTPVVIRCQPPTLTKGEKWYHVPVHRPHFVIEVHPDVPVSDWVPPGTDDSLAVRRLTQSLSEFFSREIRRDGA
ncbi:lysophospholipid acyltransferase family protein [Cupriavidus sp. 2SB]|uniref:lysophospholipid acyltransferase family protein n=1 Tax=unclassified Cupriavidus TaxID=2640874 RepID=UPI0010F981A2|nr:lysophospholipid acyltransferase family protein [Cupriavidus sp. 2SB]